MVITADKSEVEKAKEEFVQEVKERFGLDYESLEEMQDIFAAFLNKLGL